MTVVLALAALAVAGWLVCTSLVRAAVAGGLVAVTHPAPPVALVAVLAVVLVAVAAAIVWRALAPSGWRLVFATKPFVAAGHLPT